MKENDIMVIFSILHEWDSDCECGANIEFVTASEESATNELKKIKESIDKEISIINIDTDSEFSFETDDNHNYENYRIVRSIIEP